MAGVASCAGACDAAVIWGWAMAANVTKFCIDIGANKLAVSAVCALSPTQHTDNKWDNNVKDEISHYIHIGNMWTRTKIQNTFNFQYVHSVVG